MVYNRVFGHAKCTGKKTRANHSLNDRLVTQYFNLLFPCDECLKYSLNLNTFPTPTRKNILLFIFMLNDILLHSINRVVT